MKYKRKYKQSKPFRAMHGAAIGMARLGLTAAVGAGIAPHAPAGTPNMTGGFNTLSGFAPIATTASVGMSLLPKKKKGYRY